MLKLKMIKFIDSIISFNPFEASNNQLNLKSKREKRFSHINAVGIELNIGVSPRRGN